MKDREHHLDQVRKLDAEIEKRQKKLNVLSKRRYHHQRVVELYDELAELHASR